MREIELIKAIKKRCEESVRDLYYETADKKLEPRKPRILDGFYIPQEQSAFAKPDIEEIAPFIIVRPSKARERARDECVVTIDIIVQIYNKDPKFIGHYDLLVAMNRIRDNILHNPILDNVFEYDGGFEWQIQPEQPFPNWEIEIKTNWLIQNPQRTDYNEYI